MKSVNSLITKVKERISNNDVVKKVEEATNKILHKDDKECSCCNDVNNKNTEKIEELNKIQIVQPSSSSIFNRSDDIYHLFRPQDNLNSYDSSLIMRNVDKCKGTNENIKNSKRIQLYKNKGNISNFNTTIRTNLDKFKIDLSKDLRYKFLNKYGAKDDFNFDIYIFPPPPGTIPSGYYQIPGDITKWRTAYQKKWVNSGGGPSDHGWYGSYWEGHWVSEDTLYYTANFMEYSPITAKFSKVRTYSVPIRYIATEYHGGTSGSGAYTTTYSGKYKNVGNRDNNYWPSNLSFTYN